MSRADVLWQALISCPRGASAEFKCRRMLNDLDEYDREHPDEVPWLERFTAAGNGGVVLYRVVSDV